MAAEKNQESGEGTGLDQGRVTDGHIGQRLRQRRWMLGLTQQQVGDRVGIKFQQVQKYETGQNRVSASRLWDLSKALDVPVGYFYDGLSGGGTAAEGEAGVVLSPANTTGDPMADRESIDLVRLYYAIPEDPRRKLFDLVKAMAEAASSSGDADGAGPSDPAAKADQELRRQAALRLKAG